MEDEEEDFLLFENKNLWKPPVSLTDCSSEYLKDNPVPYNLLKNPFKKDKTGSVPAEYESRVWSRLGMLNAPEKVVRPAVGFLSDATPSTLDEANLYYARSVPPIRSKRAIKRERRSQKKSKLSNWFGLPRGDFSKENQEDLEVIAKRHILDPALHTRKEDGRKPYFQVGTVMDDPGSFYDRIPRKQRKKNLVDELLANAEYMKKQRRQYAILQKERQERRASVLRKKRQQLRKAGKIKTVEIEDRSLRK
ncbi:deoxynucleotidyltransferase terminal interacting [Echinococcus multilocularis]|uniref:Deoxynucleotidyltransferase terminal interacting n=1 Tax=Echinococcus multilocularis TaxID=6211 RepID=A0A068Y437_ECHMU|nr:deoxynucleotidyltransferase terminal interacting [Echinococcus multilocularis]